MPTCRYCHSEFEGDECDFCGASTGQQAEKHTYTEFAPAFYAERSIDFIERQHIFTLFLLLREVRKERSQHYDTMRVINKGTDVNDKFQDTAKEAGALYRYWTQRMWVVERIIADQLGYPPERIDDKFLNAYMRKMDKYQEKKHRIRETRQNNYTTKARLSYDLSRRD